MRIMQSKFSKRNGEIPNFFFKQLGGRGRAVLGPESGFVGTRIILNMLVLRRFFYGGGSVTNPFFLNLPAA